MTREGLQELSQNAKNPANSSPRKGPKDHQGDVHDTSIAALHAHGDPASMQAPAAAHAQAQHPMLPGSPDIEPSMECVPDSQCPGSPGIDPTLECVPDSQPQAYSQHRDSHPQLRYDSTLAAGGSGFDPTLDCVPDSQTACSPPCTAAPPGRLMATTHCSAMALPCSPNPAPGRLMGNAGSAGMALPASPTLLNGGLRGGAGSGGAAPTTPGTVGAREWDSQTWDALDALERCHGGATATPAGLPAPPKASGQVALPQNTVPAALPHAAGQGALRQATGAGGATMGQVALQPSRQPASQPTPQVCLPQPACQPQSHAAPHMGQSQSQASQPVLQPAQQPEPQATPHLMQPAGQPHVRQPTGQAQPHATPPMLQQPGPHFPLQSGKATHSAPLPYTTPSFGVPAGNPPPQGWQTGQWHHQQQHHHHHQHQQQHWQPPLPYGTGMLGQQGQQQDGQQWQQGQPLQGQGWQLGQQPEPQWQWQGPRHEGACEPNGQAQHQQQQQGSAQQPQQQPQQQQRGHYQQGQRPLGEQQWQVQLQGQQQGQGHQQKPQQGQLLPAPHHSSEPGPQAPIPATATHGASTGLGPLPGGSSTTTPLLAKQLIFTPAAEPPPHPQEPCSRSLCGKEQPSPDPQDSCPAPPVSQGQQQPAGAPQPASHPAHLRLGQQQPAAADVLRAAALPAHGPQAHASDVVMTEPAFGDIRPGQGMVRLGAAAFPGGPSEAVLAAVERALGREHIMANGQPFTTATAATSQHQQPQLHPPHGAPAQASCAPAARGSNGKAACGSHGAVARGSHGAAGAESDWMDLELAREERMMQQGDVTDCEGEDEDRMPDQDIPDEPAIEGQSSRPHLPQPQPLQAPNVSVGARSHGAHDHASGAAHGQLQAQTPGARLGARPHGGALHGQVPHTPQASLGRQLQGGHGGTLGGPHGQALHTPRPSLGAQPGAPGEPHGQALQTPMVSLGAQLLSARGKASGGSRGDASAGPHGWASVDSRGSRMPITPAAPSQLSHNLEDYLPGDMAEVYRSACGVGAQLYQWQAECLHLPGVVRGRNLVFSAPTSAGKTIVYEVLALRRLITTGRPFMLVLPTVALCEQKAKALEKLLGVPGLGKKVGRFYGGQKSAHHLDKDTGVNVCTIEMANKIINCMIEEDSLSQLGTLVVDELHMVGDNDRGYLLELLLTKLSYATQTLTAEQTKDGVNGGDETVLEDGVQVIGMSATMPNVAQVASWLGAELYETKFRPVPLKEYIKSGNQLKVCGKDGLEVVRVLKPPTQDWNFSKDPDHIALLANETTSQGHSCLIFCGTKLSTVNIARLVAEMLGTIRERDAPMPSSEGAASIQGDSVMADAAASTGAMGSTGMCTPRPTGQAGGPPGTGGPGSTTCALDTTPQPAEPQSSRRQALVEELKKLNGSADLVTVVERGVAFHHAGLSMDERVLVERAYRQGVVLVLCCTSTMAIGVNLPARRVIFRHTWQGNSMPLTVSQYRQMSGRAGRAGIDEAGESIIIVGAKDNESKLTSSDAQPAPAPDIRKHGRYITSEAAPIESCLVEGKRGMKRAMLEAVVCGAVKTSPDVARFIKCTLLCATQEEGKVAEVTKTALKWLQKEGFISWNNTSGLWTSSPLGKATVDAVMDPDVVLVVKKDLELARQRFVMATDLHLTYVLTPAQAEITNINWQRYCDIAERLSGADAVVMERIGLKVSLLRKYKDNKGAAKDDERAKKDEFRVARKFFAALALLDIINEVPLADVAERYGLKSDRDSQQDVLPLKDLHEKAGKASRMVGALCSQMGWSDLEMLVTKFGGRLRMAAQADMVALTQVSGVGTYYAGLLHKAGIRSVEGLAMVDVSRITEILVAAKPAGIKVDLKEEQGKASRISKGAKTLVETRLAELRAQAEAALAELQQDSHPLPNSTAQPNASLQPQQGQSQQQGHLASVALQPQQGHVQPGQVACSAQQPHQGQALALHVQQAPHAAPAVTLPPKWAHTSAGAGALPLQPHQLQTATGLPMASTIPLGPVTGQGPHPTAQGVTGVPPPAAQGPQAMSAHPPPAGLPPTFQAGMLANEQHHASAASHAPQPLGLGPADPNATGCSAHPQASGGPTEPHAPGRPAGPSGPDGPVEPEAPGPEYKRHCSDEAWRSKGQAGPGVPTGAGQNSTHPQGLQRAAEPQAWQPGSAAGWAGPQGPGIEAAAGQQQALYARTEAGRSGPLGLPPAPGHMSDGPGNDDGGPGNNMYHGGPGENSYHGRSHAFGGPGDRVQSGRDQRGSGAVYQPGSGAALAQWPGAAAGNPASFPPRHSGPVMPLQHQAGPAMPMQHPSGPVMPMQHHSGPAMQHQAGPQWGAQPGPPMGGSQRPSGPPMGGTQRPSGPPMGGSQRLSGPPMGGSQRRGSGSSQRGSQREHNFSQVGTSSASFASQPLWGSEPEMCDQPTLPVARGPELVDTPEQLSALHASIRQQPDGRRRVAFVLCFSNQGRSGTAIEETPSGLQKPSHGSQALKKRQETNKKPSIATWDWGELDGAALSTADDGCYYVNLRVRSSHGKGAALTQPAAAGHGSTMLALLMQLLWDETITKVTCCLKQQLKALAAASGRWTDLPSVPGFKDLPSKDSIWALGPPLIDVVVAYWIRDPDAGHECEVLSGDTPFWSLRLEEWVEEVAGASAARDALSGLSSLAASVLNQGPDSGGAGAATQGPGTLTVPTIKPRGSSSSQNRTRVHVPGPGSGNGGSARMQTAGSDAGNGGSGRARAADCGAPRSSAGGKPPVPDPGRGSGSTNADAGPERGSGSAQAPGVPIAAMQGKVGAAAVGDSAIPSAGSIGEHGNAGYGSGGGGSGPGNGVLPVAPARGSGSGRAGSVPAVTSSRSGGGDGGTAVAAVAAAAGPASSRWCGIPQLESMRQASLCRKLWESVELQLTAEGLITPLLEIEMPLVAVLASMEMTGMGVVQHKLIEQEPKLTQRCSDLTSMAYKAVGGFEFNLKSPMAVKSLLFSKMAVEDSDGTKKQVGLELPVPPGSRDKRTGKISTSSSFLQEIAHEHAVVPIIMHHRTASKQLSDLTSMITRCDGLKGSPGIWLLPPSCSSSVPRAVYPMHGTYLQTKAVTGRLAMAEPNLQNIPNPKELDTEQYQVLLDGQPPVATIQVNMRAAFVPRPRHVLLSVDYAQFELRTMAHLSGDPGLVTMLSQAQHDPFRAMAAAWKRIAPDTVTKTDRDFVKRLCYGLLYGLGSFSLSKELGVTAAEALNRSKEFKAGMPVLMKWMERVVKEAKVRGYVETLAGRRRYMRGLHQESSAYDRSAINTVCQGSAADLAKCAMLKIHAQLKQPHLKGAARLVHMVHDSFVVEVQSTRMAEVALLVEEAMMHAWEAPTHAPLGAPSHHAPQGAPPHAPWVAPTHAPLDAPHMHPGRPPNTRPCACPSPLRSVWVSPGATCSRWTGTNWSSGRCSNSSSRWRRGPEEGRRDGPLRRQGLTSGSLGQLGPCSVQCPELKQGQ